MSVEKARAHLKKFGADGRILEFPVSSATVELAAEAAGVIPARIAKTLSFHGKDGGALLIVAAGDAKIDNRKFKDRFSMKARMLSADEALEFTGHAVGGVCPFGVPDDVEVYLDDSMKRFETVFPAAGESNNAIELTLPEFEEFSLSRGWVDVCKLPEEAL